MSFVILLRGDQMAEKTFEESVAELNAIIERLGAENTTLDESLDLFSRGMSLVGQCRHRLDEASARIQLLLRQDTEAASFAPLTASGAVPPARIPPQGQVQAPPVSQIPVPEQQPAVQAAPAASRSAPPSSQSDSPSRGAPRGMQEAVRRSIPSPDDNLDDMIPF